MVQDMDGADPTGMARNTPSGGTPGIAPGTVVLITHDDVLWFETPREIHACDRVEDVSATLAAIEGSKPPPAPQLNIPLLVFHGLRDTALHSNGLNNTWDWNDSDTTIVSAPQANHFVQQDAADLVTTTLKWWLLSRH